MKMSLDLLPLCEHMNYVQKNLTEIEIFSSILFRCDLHGLQQASPLKSRKFSDKKPKWTLFFLTGHLLVRLKPRFFSGDQADEIRLMSSASLRNRELFGFTSTQKAFPHLPQGDTRLQIKVEIILETVKLRLDTLLNGLNTCWGHF